MALDFDGVVRALAKGGPAAVYLIAGDEPLQLMEATDAVRAKARAAGYTEREVLDVEPHFDWNSLARSAASLSLFASRRLIELRLPTGRADRDGAAAIIEWCKAPPPDTLLLVSAMQWSKKHELAWVKAIEKVGVYAWLRAPRVDQLPGWIRARMQARGFKPDADAVALLAAHAEGNLLAIAQEIDKLAASREGGAVGADELAAVGADNAVYDVFKLTDAAFAGDARRALTVLDGLRAEGEDPVPLLGWVLNQLDLALRLASAPDFATGARNEHGLWSGREKLFADALRRAGRGTAHWRRCLVECARIDRMTKGRVQDAAGRAMGDPWRELERLIVAIANPGSANVLLAA
ncbi:MAG TPA: DNA polymerase III subunit delta [Rhodanobacteraceae bacterium]|nr:DNA polymerase III subunit delta [Rhodanobacteraceae bacterium]